MDSKDDSINMFLDSNLNAQKNPEFINFLTQDQENKIKGAQLEFRDYIAIFIALLETVFVPVIVLMVMFVILGLLLSGFLSDIFNQIFFAVDSALYPIPGIILNILIVIIVLFLCYLVLKRIFSIYGRPE